MDLQIGILGAGSWATQCAAVIEGLPNARIAACHDPSAQSAAAFAARFGCQVVPTEEELFGCARIDATCLFTPNDLHFRQAHRLLENGKHVFLEKPITQTADEADCLIAQARRAGRILFSGHQRRRELQYRKMAELVKDGAIGRIVLAEATYSYDSRADCVLTSGNWRFDPRRTPAMSMAQLGVHMIDLLNLLVGNPRFVQGWSGCTGALGPIEDVCLARIEYQNGPSAVVHTAYSSIDMRAVRLLGDQGSLDSAGERRLELRSLSDSGLKTRTFDFPKHDAVAEEFNEFIECCLTGRRPETDGETGRRVVCVLEAIIRSINNGSRTEPVEAGCDDDRDA